ncbi:hypothetical protein Agub_g12082, partial [Astrephomene gubernaculifera]
MPFSTALLVTMNRVSALRAVAAAFLWLIVACGAATFAFFFAVTPTRWNSVRATELITWRNTQILQYKFVNSTTGRTTALLSGSVSFMLIWQSCGTLAVALAASGLHWLLTTSSPASSPSSPPSSVASNVPAPQSRSNKRRFMTPLALAKKSVLKARRLLRTQVPPRGLWRALLGPEGLSLLDLLLILLWFGLHAMWMYEMTMRVLDNRRTAPPPPKAVVRSPPPPVAAASNAVMPANATVRISPPPANRPPPTATKVPFPPPPPPARVLRPLPRVVQTSVAQYFGWIVRLDMWLLFYPLPRCNFLGWLLGSEFAAMLKYHRWLGHGTLIITTLHGIMYLAIWARDGIMASNLTWNMSGGVNNVAGLVALAGGWLLWITSIPLIRRRLFNLFYASHITGAVVFFLFSFMHRKDVATWMLPGIFLYLLDVVLRTIQQNFNSTQLSVVTADPSSAAPSSSTSLAALSPEGNILTLSLACHESLTWVGSEIVFLNVPAVSWWQWQPFTIASCPATLDEGCGGGERRMVLHIKKCGRWTQRLIHRLATDPTPVQLYVSGPYDTANRKWMQGSDRSVFIAGGIGVTPVLGMLQELIAVRRRTSHLQPSNGSNGRVNFIWICRTREELSIMPPEILQEASRKDKSSWLNLQLYLTAPAATSDSVTAGGEHGDVRPGCGWASTAKAMTAVRIGCLGGAAAADNKGSVPSGTPRARPLSHPYSFGPLMWAAALLLCFGGGFTGLICAQSYEAHMARTVKTRSDFVYVGMLQFSALGIGAALPPAILMLVAHMYRRFNAMFSHKRSTAQNKAAAAASSASDSSSCPSSSTSGDVVLPKAPAAAAAAHVPSRPAAGTISLIASSSAATTAATPAAGAA